MPVTTKPMTSEELFAIPYEEDVERYLFRGEYREHRYTRDEMMTKRNPQHSEILVNIATILKNWKKANKKSVRVFAGEAYFRLRKDPVTNVGIDVVVCTEKQADATKHKAKYVDGPPLVAIEILSPSDTIEGIDEKIEEYLDCGTGAVWIVEPFLATVENHRLNREQETFTLSQTIMNQPELPGFSCAVTEIFEN